MPNKPKLTKEFIDEFCKYTASGLGIKDCCDICGITQSCFYLWKQEAETGFVAGKESRGKAANLNIKIEFFDKLKKANAKFKAVHINRINKASEKEWQASAWMLERKFPDEFAKPDRFKVLGATDSFEDLTPLAELLSLGEE